MDAAELDILLEELESRVERLRSLYEQYFLGIEKIPPNVAQKDVDRRIYVLRREQIRNTAKRFKLQTTIQRYNTFQQYWMRILREIENGTYRRHVLRAEKTVGLTAVLTAGERKRLGLPERPAQSTRPPAADAATPALSNNDPVGDRQAPVEAQALTTSGPSALTPQRAKAQDGYLDDLDDDLDHLDMKGHFAVAKELDDPLLSSMPPPLHARKASARPVPRRSARPIAALHGQMPSQTSRSNPTSSAEPSSRSRPPAEPAATTPPGQPGRRSLRPPRFATGSGSPAATGGLRLPASSAVAGRGLPPLVKPGVPRGAPPKIPSSPIIALDNKPRPPLAVAPARPQRPSTEPIPPTAKVVPSPAATSQADSSSDRGSVPRGLPNPSESIAPRRSAPSGRTTTKSTRPETAKKPAAPPSRLPPALPQRQAQNPPLPSHSDVPPRKAADTMDRARIEQLAEKLRDARKQTNEPSAVSVDALAKKLQTTAEDLRKKHAGKRVDFDVVIKDGKAILKPIVK